MARVCRMSLGAGARFWLSGVDSGVRMLDPVSSDASRDVFMFPGRVQEQPVRSITSCGTATLEKVACGADQSIRIRIRSIPNTNHTVLFRHKPSYPSLFRPLCFQKGIAHLFEMLLDELGIEPKTLSTRHANDTLYQLSYTP